MMKNFEQPYKSFVEELQQPLHTQAPPAWHLRTPLKEEADVSKARLLQEFPDEEGLLETAYEDFNRFMEVCNMHIDFQAEYTVCRAEHAAMECSISARTEGNIKSIVGGVQAEDREGGFYTIRTAYRETPCFEACEIIVTERECTVYAQDTEGIRRGLIWLEDEMSRREGPYLPLGTVERKPYVKTRISRNFFSPNPNLHGAEELADTQDYYPEEYLNRLAHDGINGLWILVRFRNLLPSKVIPEYGQQYKPMIEKLRTIVARCRRYGIRIYVLGIEPASTYQNPALREHPEMLGSGFWGGREHAVCISTEKGRAYIEECGRNLFTLVPNLAGMINISVGEAVAGCGSVGTPDEITCPHCKAAGLTKAQALAAYEKALLKGMREAKPDAELISWTYSHRSWNREMVEEYLSCRSKEVILMENFEDAGEVLQLGKPHLAMDYFLSYTGPGEIFKKATEFAEKRTTPLYAKLQVCNSHEVASVPYVPVPGKLYDKFRYMYEHGIEGAVYCWYFGNYPSLMNKAASELAFYDFTERKTADESMHGDFPERKSTDESVYGNLAEHKESFLRKLAGIYWGMNCDPVVKVWQKFEQGYNLFPVNVAFTWFGPMTDGVVWPLHLEPVDLPVSSNWTLDDEVGTDRVGEFIAMGHTLEDAIRLCSDMYQYMAEGVQNLEQAVMLHGGKAQQESDTAGAYLHETWQEQLSVAKALVLMFESGTNIMRFYDLRDKLAYEKQADAQQRLLSKLHEIAEREAEITAEMMILCEKDSRLGYHSEADGYKFFPEKLVWRLEKLKELEQEFETVQSRIGAGQPALPFYYGLTDHTKTYQCDPDDWEQFEEGTGKIRISDTGEAYKIELVGIGAEMVEIRAEFALFHPYIPVYISAEGKVSFLEPTYYFMHDSLVAGELKKWHVKRCEDRLVLTLYKADFDLLDDRPFRLSVKVGKHSWKKSEQNQGRLIWGRINPESMVFILT